MLQKKQKTLIADNQIIVSWTINPYFSLHSDTRYVFTVKNKEQRTKYKENSSMYAWTLKETWNHHNSDFSAVLTITFTSDGSLP